ncbi:hypothetical protein LCGC14_0492740 [marine sediment metagenome]|uniref:Uncharacterized protein n=1 Tax=marine sediment metagenome TaxID=412755 RepID=A0A0F9UT24_9ZZZZ|nr:MAG: hypothetical protein Lokiarch_50810 [Candidatus Lokiarchaeum sp. GC14_75]
MGKSKKVDIRKRRLKLIKEKKKELQKKSIKIEKRPSKELDLRLEKETKLYWIRAITGISSAIIGRLIFGLIGWFMLIWMLIWWFLFPFIVSFIILKYKYDPEEWNWKRIIMPGVGIFFFLFMIGGIFTHTMLRFFPKFSSVLELLI